MCFSLKLKIILRISVRIKDILRDSNDHRFILIVELKYLLKSKSLQIFISMKINYMNGTLRQIGEIITYFTLNIS